MEMSRLPRDGTAEPVSRDQILRHARVQGNIIFPVQLTTSRIGNLTRLIHTLLYVMTIHTYIHTYVSRITSTSIPPENPLYRGLLRRSRCVLIFSSKYPFMTINDNIQYTSVHFTIYPSPYSCMSRWYYYRQ